MHLFLESGFTPCNMLTSVNPARTHTMTCIVADLAGPVSCNMLKAFNLAAFHHGCSGVSQQPAARNWLVAGQRQKNSHSAQNFYTPMSLNRCVILPSFTIVLLLSCET